MLACGRFFYKYWRSTHYNFYNISKTTKQIVSSDSHRRVLYSSISSFQPNNSKRDILDPSYTSTSSTSKALLLLISHLFRLKPLVVSPHLIFETHQNIIQMIRRSSINEDVLWQRYCATPDRVSIALESLALLPENNSSYIYGSTRSDGNLTQDADYQPRRTSSVGEKILEEGAILKDELVAMISLSIPVIATYVLEIIPGMITLFLVGKMDNGDDDKNKLYLDAAALGVMFYNIVGLSTVSYYDDTYISY